MTRQTVGDESRNGGLNVVGALTAGSISNPTFTGVASFPDGSASAPSITNTGDTNTGIFHPAEDTVAISTGGSERARVDASGRVQIGGTSTNPSRLYVRQAWQTGNGIAQIDTPSGESLSGITFANNGATKAYLYHETSGDRLWLASAGSGGVSLGYNAVSEVFRINGNGLITGTGTSLGAWTAYTPALTAATTNPTLGTGSSATGAYCQIGKTIIWKARIAFGTSGTAAGSGVYRVSLPVNAKETSRLAGTGFLIDSSAGTVQTVSLFINAAGTVEMYTNGGTSFNSVASNSVPWAWDASDSITINGTYEIA